MVMTLQEEIGESIRITEVLRQNDSESLVEARDLERRVPVVLKVLDLEVVGGADALPSFELEAARAVGFRHRNIATAEPLQRRPTLVFYALNVGYAKTLESVLSAGAPPSFERSIEILQGIAAALDYEHSQGSIHGRLAPEMIFVDADHVLVSGFGGMQGAESYPGNGATLYQAPEQGAWRHEIDGRVDVYALGVIAYQLLSGKRGPRSAPSGASPAEPLRISRNVTLAPGISLHVNDAILRAIAKRPSQRFATAGEFIVALGASQSERVRKAPQEAPNEPVVLTAADIWTRLLDGGPGVPDEAPGETEEMPRVPDEVPRVPDAVRRVPDEVRWVPDEEPRVRRPRLAMLPPFSPRLATALGIGFLCVAGALTIFSVRKKISVPRFPPAFVGTLSHLSPLKVFNKWIVELQPHQPPTPVDSGSASGDVSGPRITSSGVVVENGVLLFPGEKGSDSSGSSRASSGRRTAVNRLITKPTAH
jgi:protein kinase-like protein